MKDLLLLTPPFTQLNTPYPATAYLKGFLNTKDISAFQMDLGIEVILSLFSKSGLEDLFSFAAKKGQIHSENAQRIFALKNLYIGLIDEVILFLQGKNQTLARQICSENFLPQASRFETLSDLEWAFGTMGIQDKAKHLATLFLEDIADFIKETVDENFGFSRYAERLGRSANSFDELYEALQSDTYIDELTLSILKEKMESVQAKLVCFSVPFPGNLYSAFKCAQFLKKEYPKVKTAMGGGFPNTELRSVSDVRVFDFFDYITLDDGELPIELLVSNIKNPNQSNPDFNFYKRTFLVENGAVLYNNFSLRKDYAQNDLGTPDYSDLLLDNYISVIEIANPMHSLWSDGRWNKLTMAHGCYWGKCTFCDISLDYIKLYEPITAQLLVDRMETIIAQTGERGFHFVDEAAPPALMRALSLEILRRNLKVSWWTNIRFEKSFSYDLCRLLQAAGCIAVSGGLEVASNRLLKLIQKGVTVEQVAQVSRNLTESGIMVHAYLMYAYPTQTVQETVDSLEMVRQLFELGVLQSGFWHQFALTVHSPVGMDPESYNITPQPAKVSFANNDLAFVDHTGIDHDQFSYGLKKSLFNYMHGSCFDFPLQEWFEFEIPPTTIPNNFIQRSLEDPAQHEMKPSAKVIWLGDLPKPSRTKKVLSFDLHDKTGSAEISLPLAQGEWLLKLLPAISIQEKDVKTYAQVKSLYEKEFEDFLSFWYGDSMELLREFGLLVL
ncbi:MAG: radical SAM protein [Saprospiraceae bacterium]